MILGCRAIHGFAGSDAIRVISVRYRIRALGYRGKPPAVLPGEVEAVPVGKGVADFIIGDGLAVDKLST